MLATAQDSFHESPCWQTITSLNTCIKYNSSNLNKVQKKDYLWKYFLLLNKAPGEGIMTPPMSKMTALVVFMFTSLDFDAVGYSPFKRHCTEARVHFCTSRTTTVVIKCSSQEQLLCVCCSRPEAVDGSSAALKDLNARESAVLKHSKWWIISIIRGAYVWLHMCNHAQSSWSQKKLWHWISTKFQSTMGVRSIGAGRELPQFVLRLLRTEMLCDRCF